MNPLIIAATTAEIQPFLSAFPQAPVLITGVGAVQTMYKIGQAFRTGKYDAIWQCGIAGTYSDKIDLGEAVWVEKDRFADLGVNESDSFTSVFSLGLADENAEPYHKSWLINPHTWNQLNDVKQVSANTINMLTEDQTLIRRLSLQHQVDIETMEGAALHYYGLMEKLPFLQIRGISNQVGVRNKNQWRMQEAIQSSNDLLIRLYQSLPF